MANTKITSKVIADANILTAAIADNAVTGDKVADDVALAGNPTTTTQTAGNSTTRVATTAFVSTAISNLVDSSPSALNTLNELAAALGDDANFSTTVTNSIATKLPLAGGTLTGNIAHAGNFSLDVGGNLTLDADGDHTIFAYGGSGEVGRVSNESENLVIYSLKSDKDIKFNGVDSSSTITALTLDMSAAGAATFNSSITIADYVIHAGDSNTYFGFNANDNFELFTGGSDRMSIVGSETVFNDGSEDKDFRVESNGNANMLFVDGGNDRVGIGASPSSGLHLTGGSNTASKLTLTNTAPSPDNTWSLHPIYNGQDLLLNEDSDTRVAFKSGGNVFLGTSIGTPSGDGLVQILGGSSGSGNFSALTLQHHNSTTTNDGASLDFEGRYNTNPWNFGRIKTYNNGSGFGANMDFDIHPADGNQNPSLVTAMTLRGDGGSAAKVGIGSTTPKNTLDLGSATTGRGITFTNYSNIISEYSNASTHISSNYYPNAGAAGYKVGASGNFGAAGVRVHGTGGGANSGIIQFYADSNSSKTADDAFTPTERVRINSSGAADAATLQVFNSRSDAFNHVQENLVANLTNGETLYLGVGKANSTKNTGYVGYTWDSDASNNNYIHLSHWGSNSLFRVYGNGDYYFAGSNVSDRDKKENIKEVSGTSLDKITQIPIKSFRMKSTIIEGEEIRNQKTGFIAQEVQPLLPDVVTGTDGQGDMGIDTVGVIAHLVRAIKELEARVKELEG